jgi:DNA-binding MarR family transcriptional regulator
MTTVAPPSIDVASLAMLAGGAIERHVLTQLRGHGHPRIKTSHGFVFQHLIDGTPTVGELATKLRITQQGASKVIVELEALGYVTRNQQVGDARVRRVELTDAGRAVIALSRQVRAELDLALERVLGADGLQLFRTNLVGLLAAVGGLDVVRARAVPLPEAVPSPPAAGNATGASKGPQP